MRAVLAAGGTAGHINPALAIAREITKHGGEVLFIGNETGMEKELVPKEGYNIKCIKISGFHRSLSPKNFVTAWRAITSIAAAKKIIKEFNPDVVIGCGGYVSGPAVYGAAKLKIPTLIHEQNAFPGLTTKILSRVVDKICISFHDSEKFIKHKDKIVFTGNPVRENILELSYEKARERLNITRPTALVFGGSLGAQKINDAMIEIVKNGRAPVDIIWGTGKRNYEEIMKQITKTPENIKITPYIYNMDEVMSAADIVVARAGAITLSEICTKGKCAVLIPSPYVTNNHQEYNARALEKNGAAIIITEEELCAQRLENILKDLAEHREKIDKMSVCALKMGTPKAAKDIYSEIETLCIH